MLAIEHDLEMKEEGIYLAKKVIRMSEAGIPIEEIAKECGITMVKVEDIIKD